MARRVVLALMSCLAAAPAVAQDREGLPGAQDIWRHLPGRTAAPDPSASTPAPPPGQPPAGSRQTDPAIRADDPATSLPRALARARVVIHYPERRGGSGPNALADRLRAAGTPEVETRPVRRSVDRLSIRYFHPADRGVSGLLGALLDGGGQSGVEDFTFYRPRPRPGTVEIWLP